MYSRNIDSKKLEGKGTETDAQQYSQRRRGDTPERATIQPEEERRHTRES